MKKKSFNINIIIFALFFAATILTLIVCYFDISSEFYIKFIFGYFIFACLLLVYLLIGSFIKAKKLEPQELKKRLVRLAVLFVIFGVLNYLLDFFFRPTKIDLLHELTVALGASFGISFVDLFFFRKNQK